jgi:hypothetical protein
VVIFVDVVIVVPTLKRGLFAPNFSNPLCCILTGIIPLVFSIVIIDPLGLLRCMLNSIYKLNMLEDLFLSKNSKYTYSQFLRNLSGLFGYQK